MTIRVYCTKCDRWYADASSCACPRPRLLAAEMTTPPSRPAARCGYHTKVLLTAAALEPRSLDEMRHAIALAARALTETN